MLLSGCTDLRVVEQVAEKLKTHTKNMYIVHSAHTYDLVGMPDAVALSLRLGVLKEEKREVYGIWVDGKRTK